MAIDSHAPAESSTLAIAASTSSTPHRSKLDRALTYTGEILITLGVVLGLFVVWQLFYTDVQSGRVQDDVLDQLAWVEPVVAHGAQDETLPDVEVVQLIPQDQMNFSPEGAPVVPTPAIGETFATIHVPRWGAGYVKPISEGVDRRAVLDRLGIGHYPSTVMPGQVGNFAVAGHRTTYGKPFADVDQLQLGDAIIIQTADAWFVYEVTDTKIVKPSEVYVIGPNPLNPGNAPTAASITLTTCHPKYSAAQRFIVHGELLYWAPVGIGMPPELYEEL
jgi:sortase A